MCIYVYTQISPKTLGMAFMDLGPIWGKIFSTPPWMRVYALRQAQARQPSQVISRPWPSEAFRVGFRGFGLRA